MPRTVLKTFEVEYVQVMDKDGNVDEELMPDLSKEQIVKLYKDMWRTRLWDEKALKLQRQGRFGTFAPATGQEATQVGAATATQKEDWFVPMYRDTGAYIARGVPMSLINLYWKGDERGQKMPEDGNDFPVAVPVGSQPLHGMGIAWGLKMDGKNAAVLCSVGDGGTSEGDFHEAMNFAGVFQVPLVQIVENNQYAISVPREHQTRAETIAQKAIAYGIPGVQVDGNDVFAVYKVVQEALERARNGNGPTLVECVTYRMGDHTTADDASKYRSEEEVEKWRGKDPLKRLRLYMEAQDWWNAEKEEQVKQELKAEVDQAVKEAESIEQPALKDIFAYTHAEMPWNLQEQFEELQAAKKWEADNMPGEEQ